MSKARIMGIGGATFAVLFVSLLVKNAYDREYERTDDTVKIVAHNDSLIAFARNKGDGSVDGAFRINNKTVLYFPSSIIASIYGTVAIKKNAKDYDLSADLPELLPAGSKVMVKGVGKAGNYMNLVGEDGFIVISKIDGKKTSRAVADLRDQQADKKNEEELAKLRRQFENAKTKNAIKNNQKR